MTAKMNLHDDCLCEHCHSERKRRIGEKEALAEEARILEKAKAILSGMHMTPEKRIR